MVVGRGVITRKDETDRPEAGKVAGSRCPSLSLDGRADLSRIKTTACRRAQASTRGRVNTEEQGY